MEARQRKSKKLIIMIYFYEFHISIFFFSQKDFLSRRLAHFLVVCTLEGVYGKAKV